MTAFRVLLLAWWTAIVAYTAVVVGNHGWNLFPAFFGDIWRLGWPGQFNLDFTSMLTLSALWVGWRHRFSRPGIALAVLAFFGGGFFLTTYLLLLSFQTRGDVREMLLGPGRVAREPGAPSSRRSAAVG